MRSGEIVALLSRESVEALGQEALRQTLVKQGIEPAGSSPQGLRDQVDNEITKWAKVIQEAGITRE